MNLRGRFRSLLLRLLCAERTRRLKRTFLEYRRRLLGRPHVVSVFLQIDDPYSYLLSYFLPHLEAQYDIELRLYLSQAMGDAFQPAPQMLAEYAVTDCRRVARELGIPFLDIGAAPPTEHRSAMSDAVATLAGSDEFDEELLHALSIYWRGDSESASRRRGVDSGAGDRLIAVSRQRQSALGHYNSAMIFYAGEWYWGVDRLHYLTERLDALGAASKPSANPILTSMTQLMQVTLPVKPPTSAKNLPGLELFHSIRSPYSYLALQRTCDIADAFGISLRLRPVLPMVMRGLEVPRRKLRYIAVDAAREARRLNIPFGKFADPLGSGIARTLAACHYARQQQRDREFLVNAGTAIWSEAVDVSTDAGLSTVTDRAGLRWSEVKAAMQCDDWRDALEENRESMTKSGSWGVPTLRMGDFTVWGQDRDWLLVRHIEDLCDTKDGILV